MFFLIGSAKSDSGLRAPVSRLADPGHLSGRFTRKLKETLDSLAQYHRERFVPHEILRGNNDTFFKQIEHDFKPIESDVVEIASEQHSRVPIELDSAVLDDRRRKCTDVEDLVAPM